MFVDWEIIIVNRGGLSGNVVSEFVGGDFGMSLDSMCWGICNKL